MADLSRCIAQGVGDEPADLVIRGAKILDVMTGTVREGDVAICEDTIVGVYDRYEGTRTIDAAGLTLVPGFIDTHLHVESSLVTPFEFDRCVTPRGITTAICDPHEFANVLGPAGIRYFQDASQHLVMDLRVQLSSCVPSTAMETAGAAVTAGDIEDLRGHPSGIGLAEFMNFPGVIARDAQCLQKLELFRGGHIDGHAPLLSAHPLNGYIAAGIVTEHEATSAAEALEKLSKGMTILIREGSVSKDLAALAPIINARTAPYIALCTDDRNPLDIVEEGHLDHMIRELIRLGAEPVDVYRIGSLSAAEAFGLKDRGAIVPGRRADIVAVDTLENCRAAFVLCAGALADENAFAARTEIPPIGRNSVIAPPVDATAFRSTSNAEDTDVIGILPGKIITAHLKEAIAVEEGDKRPDPARDLARVTVIERHGKNGNISNGFVRGFGIQRGAIASTVCHDHHNIAVVGIDYGAMTLAANRLRDIEGGFVVAEGDKILAELALPVAGLMSPKPFEEVHTALRDLREAAFSLGVRLEEPFLQLAFVALPVIPALKITDCGLVDVHAFRIISRDGKA
ncbi:MAG: adenine deaminase, partial [Pseudomonadota bacterium]